MCWGVATSMRSSPSTRRFYRAQKLYGAHILAGDPQRGGDAQGGRTRLLLCQCRFLQRSPDVVERVVKAIHQGARAFAAASQRERAEIIAPYSGISGRADGEGNAGAPQKTISTRPPQLTGFDVAANQRWVDIAYREKALPARVDIAPYVNASALAPA